MHQTASVNIKISSLTSSRFLVDLKFNAWVKYFCSSSLVRLFFSASSNHEEKRYLRFTPQREFRNTCTLPPAGFHQLLQSASKLYMQRKWKLLSSSSRIKWDLQRSEPWGPGPEISQPTCSILGYFPPIKTTLFLKHVFVFSSPCAHRVTDNPTELSWESFQTISVHVSSFTTRTSVLFIKQIKMSRTAKGNKKQNHKTWN